MKNINFVILYIKHFITGGVRQLFIRYYFYLRPQQFPVQQPA